VVPDQVVATISGRLGLVTHQSTVSYMGEVTRNLQYLAVAGVNAPRLTVATGGVDGASAGDPEIAGAALIVIY
jgi:hypothetical protein